MVLSSGLVPVGPALPVAAGTAETMEAEVLTWINSARVAQGLVPFRLRTGLASVAGDRAAALSAGGVMSHEAAGCISCQLADRGIQWWANGESIGESTWPWGHEVAWSLFNGWKASPAHWELFMGSTFNYVGIGFVYNAATGTTWASVVMTESTDWTRPVARMVSRSVSDTTVSWTWRGADVALQSHTAGLRNFDVEYRVGSGPWQTIRTGTSATNLTLTGRAVAHYYGLRVRSRDWKGNLSAWTAELRAWVP
jgi:hypothetical protein